MADTKISAMPAAATLTGAELVPLVQGGVNVQSSLSSIASAVRGSYGAFHLDSITQITSDISANGTQDINVTSTASFPASGSLLCEQEVISYTGKTSTTFTGITRGAFGSSSAAHTTNAYITGAQGTAAFGTATVAINTADLENGVTLDAATSEITIANAGTYNIQFSAQFFNGASGDDNVIVWYTVDGANVAASTSLVTVSGKHAGANGGAIMTVNVFVTVSAGAVVALKWSSKGGTGVLATYQPLPTGGCPYSPGVIVTVNQIA